jgi:diguanylate cyclase (GGDEF)-like protein
MDREHKALALLHNRLRQSATTDRLTGLRNRFALERDVQRAGEQGTLLLLNIDGFGRFNDFYGTAIGDLLLKRIATELEENLGTRVGLRIYRLGAAEFGVLCDKSDCMNNTELAQEILTLFERRDFTIQEHVISLGITIGSSSEFPLLETAHLALKAVKAQRTKHLEYSSGLGLDQKIERNLYVLGQLRHAITTDRVLPYFQPIYNLHTDRIEQYECLMRVMDENGNLMMPNEFLPIAKEGRLYGELTRIMIEKSFMLFLDNDFGFHLNLSINDILDPQVKSLLFSRLEQHSDLGKRLTLELLESEQVDNYEVVADFIREAKSHGCRVAIDDFGAGYSNLSHILQLDIDNLKIDASLVKNIEHDHHAEVLVNSIIRLARQMSINVSTAEFVHNAAVLEKVRAMGIDYAQGYAIGKPRPELMPA